MLAGLRDLDGVFGSFVLTRSGELLGKDLPAVFDERLFAEVGPRVARLADALTEEGDEFNALNLATTNYKLHVRNLQESDGMLGVLLAGHANMAALTMAISVAVRRLPTRRHSSQPPAPPPPPSTVPTIPRNAIPSPLPEAGAVPYPSERASALPDVPHNDQDNQPTRPEVRAASLPPASLPPAAPAPPMRSARPVVFRGRKLRQD